MSRTGRRIALAQLPTPLEPMPRLGEWLGLERLLVKRDDLTGLALGGNKARKLELLCAEALASGCDVLVTGGGRQSNHARMTAAAACRLGLECHLALSADPPTMLSGNLVLDHVLGARLHFIGDTDDYDAIETAIDELAARLAAAGRRPFAIPVGGASVGGAIAYALAADELLAQLDGAPPGHVFVADGSGGTHAGLLAGLAPPTRVIGVNVGTRPRLEVAVAGLARLAARAADRPTPEVAVEIDHDHVGEGYAVPSGPGLAAIRETARREGIVLDPVYTGKAMAALISWARDGRIGAAETVVFWHTGGAVALFASEFAEPLAAL